MAVEDRRGCDTSVGIVFVAVAQFAVVVLLALLIVGVAANIASRRVGEREAIANARTITVL